MFTYIDICVLPSLFRIRLVIAKSFTISNVSSTLNDSPSSNALIVLFMFLPPCVFIGRDTPFQSIPHYFHMLLSVSERYTDIILTLFCRYILAFLRLLRRSNFDGFLFSCRSTFSFGSSIKDKSPSFLVCFLPLCRSSYAVFARSPSLDT